MDKKKSSAPLSVLEKQLRKATAILSYATFSGDHMMVGTATAFAKKPGKKNTYYFLTVAHCITKNDEDRALVAAYKHAWYIQFDDPGKKIYLPAKIVCVGQQGLGYDFAVLEVKTDKPIPTMRLSNSDPTLGEEMIFYGSSFGLGKVFYRCHVSLEILDRPFFVDEDAKFNGCEESGDEDEAGETTKIKMRDIFAHPHDIKPHWKKSKHPKLCANDSSTLNWTGGVMLSAYVTGGASGSAIVSQTKKQIMAVLVGYCANQTVALPISRFRKLWLAHISKTNKRKKP